MLKTQINGKEYKIRFRYFLQNGRRITLCTILQEGQPFLIGESACSIKDNFSKEIGRKKSLQRALSSISDKKERTVFWRMYWARKIG